MSITKDCTSACEAMPSCAVCGMRKKPRGRSAPLEAANGYCDDDCPGYRQEPRPGHLWPGEIDRDRAANHEDEDGP
jgi:hypothetical protein